MGHQVINCQLTGCQQMTLSAAERNALELKYDGRIPAHLLNSKTAVELELGHHQAMIRFSETRIVDFTESLARLVAGPQGPGIAAWIDRTRATIADHRADKARHEAAIAELVAPFAIAAE
jgi:hypothetical protein